MAQNSQNGNSSNQLLVPGAAQAIDQMKFEIASEFGVNLGAETNSRAN
ncbi:small, acid-soluble spore protein, alpha/beta type, partial [Bacillus atrophaeus]